MSLWGLVGTVAGGLLDNATGSEIGALGGALDQSGSAGSANAAQQQATQAAIEENRRQFDLTRGDFAKYRQVGGQALGQLQQDINRPVTAAEVMAQPGYQFGLDQGLQALDRGRAAAGGRISGAALKAATEYGTDYATRGYGAEYQRRQDRLNRLAALAGIGQTATSGTSFAGQNTTNAISSALTSQGDATAAYRLAGGNIWGNAANNIGSQLGRWWPPAAGGGGYPFAVPQSSATLANLYGPEGYG